MATFVIFSHLRNCMHFHLLTSSLKSSLVFKNIIHIGITLFLLFLFPVTLLLMYVGFLFFYILFLLAICIYKRQQFLHNNFGTHSWYAPCVIPVITSFPMSCGFYFARVQTLPPPPTSPLLKPLWSSQEQHHSASRLHPPQSSQKDLFKNKECLVIPLPKLFRGFPWVENKKLSPRLKDPMSPGSRLPPSPALSQLRVFTDL